MPQLGETVADGTVTKWFKSVGDHVARGDTLFEVSTDKVDTEIPAQAEGVLTKILVNEGETVDVGTVLAIIGDEDPDEALSATSAPPRQASTGPRTSATVRSVETEHVSPVVRRLLAEHHLDARDLVGSGPQGRITRDDVLSYVEDATTGEVGASASPTSPVVRKLLRDNGIDPSSLEPSGPEGRLLRRDVEAAIGQMSSSSSPSTSGDEVIPFTKIRRLTAEHMIRSKATSAHTLMVREVDFEHVEEVRRQHGDAFKAREGFSLTYLPFNALATIEALRDFANLNASVGDDELIIHREVHLGIAVDLDGNGLVVPVVHDAGTHTLTSMARRIRELATGARTKQLTVDDVSRGTFTITNPGPFGTLITGAIINQPQVAILATDGVVRKPVVVIDATGTESIAIHSVGMLALTFDHRVIDGAYAAQFLARIADILQHRDWQSEL
jgi:2-oxoglutarate dehydrogenase E2 component (dihydrolipoamide succinyltransferase)